METKEVRMTAEEAAEFAAFKADKEKKESLVKQKEERDAYKALVDETINNSMPLLQDIAEQLRTAKSMVLGNFQKLLDIKSDIFNIKENQKTHTFTNSESDKRIMVGNYVTDGYRDTVNEGITIVKDYLASLAKDKESQMMVRGILKLLSKDSQGNLKASRVLELRAMAIESGNERFVEGVNIISESYQPAISKTFVRCEIKDNNGEWKAIPLGMTEA